MAGVSILYHPSDSRGLEGPQLHRRSKPGVDPGALSDSTPNPSSAVETKVSVTVVDQGHEFVWAESRNHAVVTNILSSRTSSPATSSAFVVGSRSLVDLGLSFSMTCLDQSVWRNCWSMWPMLISPRFQWNSAFRCSNVSLMILQAIIWSQSIRHGG